MEEVGKYPGLMLRGTTYYLRVSIPADLLEVYAPRKEIWRSLRTKSHKEAVRLYRIELLRFDQEFERERTKLLEQPKASLTDTELQRLKALYIHESLASDDAFREEGSREGPLIESIARQLEGSGVEFGSPWSAEDIYAPSGMSERDFQSAQDTVETLLPVAKKALARGNTELFDWEHSEYLKAKGYDLPRGSREFRKASLALLEAAVEALEAKEARLQGRIVKTPEAPEVVSMPEGGKGISLSQAFERWRGEHRGPRKTCEEFKAQVERFISLHGDLPIDQINKGHIRSFKDAMLRYPAKLSGKERRLPVPEVLKRYEGQEILRLAPSTINEKCLAALKAVLGHCEKEGLLDSNPATGVRAKEDRRKEPARLPLTDEDIKIVLAFPIFTQGERPAAGGGEAAKWLPLLAMYTGARLEELARLTTADVREEEGVPFIHIRDEVKTQSSYRKTPIHSKLIVLGFLDYARGLGKGPLFPLLKWDSEKVSSAWSKWWTRYRRKHGLDDPKKTFHSFRHTVKRKLRNARVEKTLRDAIMGHEAEDEAERYGLDHEGQGVSLVVLREAVEKVEYPE